MVIYIFLSLSKASLITIHNSQLTTDNTKKEKISIRKMSEVTAGSFAVPNHNQGFVIGRDGHYWRRKWNGQQCYHPITKSPKSYTAIKNQMVKPSTFSSRINTDIPLYESPGASFDQYLDDKPRLFKAMFPDKRRSQRLNEEEWRVQMLPIQFLFATVWPVIDMRLRCKSTGKDYPPGVSRDITKVLELDITRWKLEGLDSVLEPSHFSLGVKGALYPDRRGVRSRLKGELEMKISFVLPPMLSLVPQDVLQSVAESVLKTLVENMKHKVNDSLLADYSDFKREKSKSLA